MQSASGEQRNLGMMATEDTTKEQNLAFLAELLSNRDYEKSDLALTHNGGGEESLEASPGSSDPGSGVENSVAPLQENADDLFLKPENERSDYDWLLTPPGTPFMSPLKKEQKAVKSPNMNHLDPLKPKPSNSEAKSLTPRNNKMRQNPGLSPKTKPTSVPFRRLSTSGGQPTTAAAAKINRSATPIGRSSLPTTASKMNKPLRSSTPTSRAAVSSSSSTKPKPAAASAPPVRSSTPTSAAPRSATPTAASRPFPVSKTGSRSSTPTHRAPLQSNNCARPSNSSSSSAPATRSSSVSKINPVPPSRGMSPSTRSTPLMTSTKMIPSSKTAQPCRPVSAASKTRALPVSNQNSVAAVAQTNGRPRRQSCSPSRGQKSVANGSSSCLVPGINRSRPAATVNNNNSSSSDSPNPVLMGTKMVERVIHMRRLPPPKQDTPKGNGNTSGGGKSSKSAGFGRSLSKKSLDMAMRHMDIKGGSMKGVNTTARQSTTNFPASSSMYSSSRSNGSSKSKSVGISDSPLATSSSTTTSSELSVNNINNNNSHCLDGGDLEEAESTRREGA